MPVSHKSPHRRRIFGAIALCFLGVLFVAARQQGWLGSAPDADPMTAGDSAGDARIADREVSASDDADTLQLPPEEVLVQSEPEPAVTAPEPQVSEPPKKRVRHSQWTSSATPPRVERDDATAAEGAPAKRSRVVPAGLEDGVPPPDSEDKPADDSAERKPADRKPAAADKKKTTIARRPAETSSGAVPAEPDAAQPGRKPLMEHEQIQSLIDAGNYVEAQQALSRWYWQQPAERERLLPQLNKLAQPLYFAPQPQYYEPYVVKPGDQLRLVGQRFGLSWEYIAKLNHIDARKIRMGQKLKVVPGPFGAIVFLDRYELVVHLGGSFVKSYRVGVGKDGATPLGTFAVKNKMVDPTYYGPEGVISHDDPSNPLGERWIDIGDGYGIHGTIEPGTIGKNESRGCIRMLNSDVEEVYDFLVIGSEVRILRQ